MAKPSKSFLKLELNRADQDTFGGRQIVSVVIPPEDVELQVDPKRSCKKCYGRGYELFLDGNGYKIEEKKVPKLQTGVGSMVEYHTEIRQVANLKRISRPCPCTFRHARFKLRAAAAKAKFAKKKVPDVGSVRSEPV